MKNSQIFPINTCLFLPAVSIAIIFSSVLQSKLIIGKLYKSANSYCSTGDSCRKTNPPSIKKNLNHCKYFRLPKSHTSAIVLPFQIIITARLKKSKLPAFQTVAVPTRPWIILIFCLTPDSIQLRTHSIRKFNIVKRGLLPELHIELIRE